MITSAISLPRSGGRMFFKLSLLSIGCWLTIIAGCGNQVEASSRCDLLCHSDSLREQCERCKLRVPMRFGKRSSPPEYFLDDPFRPDSEPQTSPDYVDNSLMKEVFNYLSSAQRQGQSTSSRRRERAVEAPSQPQLSSSPAPNRMLVKRFWRYLLRSLLVSPKTTKL